MALILGRTLGKYIINYNSCLALSLLFTFLSFIIFISITVDHRNANKGLDVKKSIAYFKDNRIFCFYLVVNVLGSIVWGCLLAMPMLILTENLNFSEQSASFLILGLGIVSTISSMIVLKYLRFKNDHINLFFKYGIRILLYLMVALTGNRVMLIITVIYMLLTNSTHNFIFSSFFINNIAEEYSMVLTTLKYCTSLIGDAIGVFMCGLVFNSSIALLALPSLIVGLVHYLLATILVEKKKNFSVKEV